MISVYCTATGIAQISVTWSTFPDGGPKSLRQRGSVRDEGEGGTYDYVCVKKLVSVNPIYGCVQLGTPARKTSQQQGGTVQAKSCTVPIFVPFRLCNGLAFVVHIPDMCNCTVPYIPRTVPAYAVRDPA